jgi:hypothetical protein
LTFLVTLKIWKFFSIEFIVHSSLRPSDLMSVRRSIQVPKCPSMKEKKSFPLFNLSKNMIENDQVVLIKFENFSILVERQQKTEESGENRRKLKRPRSWQIFFIFSRLISFLGRGRYSSSFPVQIKTLQKKNATDFGPKNTHFEDSPNQLLPIFSAKYSSPGLRIHKIFQGLSLFILGELLAANSVFWRRNAHNDIFSVLPLAVYFVSDQCRHSGVGTLSIAI